MTIGPVELIEVEVVGLQALQACVQGLVDLLAGMPRPAPQVFHATSGTRRLAGDDQVVALATLLQPAADIGFGAALRLGLRRHRIHLGGVDEIDVGGDGTVELFVRFGFGVLLTERHRAETQARNLHVGLA